MDDKPTNRHRDLRSLIRDDAYAASFQSLGQYRTALLQADDIYRAVNDAHRPEGEACRHEMTPNYLEYPDRPTFDESADMDPCMLGGGHE